MAYLRPESPPPDVDDDEGAVEEEGEQEAGDDGALKAAAHPRADGVGAVVTLHRRRRRYRRGSRGNSGLRDWDISAPGYINIKKSLTSIDCCLEIYSRCKCSYSTFETGWGAGQKKISKKIGTG